MFNLSKFTTSGYRPIRSAFQLLPRRNYSVNNIIQGGAPPVVSRGQQVALACCGGLATFGLLSLVARGLTTKPASISSSDRPFPTAVKARLRSTYGHVVGGLGVTALSAAALFRTGAAHRLMSMNKWLAIGLPLAGTIGSMVVCQSVDYNASPALKYASWLAFNGFIALSLCPLGAVGGTVLYRAALASGAIVGSLSAVAAAAPSDAFLNWGGPLSIGLGVIVAASFGQMFFPASSILYNVSLYGGLGLFSLMTMFDTQKLMANARGMPQYGSGLGGFDPVNASMSIYLDYINIFVRMVMIMSGNQRKR